MAKAKQMEFDAGATLGFEDKLWHAAELMRGKLPATQYRQVLMGLLFLRYVSDAFDKRYQELKAEGYGDEEDRDAYAEKNIFFVPKAARWEKIAEKKHELTPGLFAGGKVEEADGEPFDQKMKRLGATLDELFGESAKLEKAIRQNLKAIGLEVG